MDACAAIPSAFLLGPPIQEFIRALLAAAVAAKCDVFVGILYCCSDCVCAVLWCVVVVLAMRVFCVVHQALLVVVASKCTLFKILTAYYTSINSNTLFPLPSPDG